MAHQQWWQDKNEQCQNNFIIIKCKKLNVDKVYVMQYPLWISQKNNKAHLTYTHESNSSDIHKTNIHSTITEWSTVLPTSEINSIIYFSFIGHKTTDDLLNQKLQGIPHWQTGGKTFNKLVPVPYLTGQLPTFLKLWIKTYKDHCLLKTNKITLDYKWSGNFPLS